jgi:hypothetical protein
MPNIRSRRNLELRYLILTVVKLFFINRGETKVYRSPKRLKVILLEMDDIGEVWPDKLFEAEEMFSNTEWINSKMDAAVQFSQQVTFSKSIQLQQALVSPVKNGSVSRTNEESDNALNNILLLYTHSLLLSTKLTSGRHSCCNKGYTISASSVINANIVGGI